MFERISKWPANREGLFFLLIFSAVLKGAMVFSNKVINPDGLLYISVAQQFGLGDFSEAISIFRLPFYPLLLSLVHYIIPNWVLAGRFISITALVLVLIPLYLLSKELFGRKAAFWACLAFVISPLPNEWALDIVRNPPFLLFFAWAAYFSLRGIREAKTYTFIATVFFSWIAVLFRIEGIIVVPAYFVYLLVLAVSREEKRVQYIKGILIWIAFPCFLFSTLFLLLGENLSNLHGMGLFIKKIRDFFSLSFMANYHSIYENLKIMEANSHYPSGKQNFAEIARHLMPFLYLYGLFRALIKVIFPFFIIPFFWAFKRPLNREHFWIFFLVAAYLLMVYQSLIETDFLEYRFLLTPAFLLYPWIGVGTERMLIAIKRSSYPRLATSIVLIIFLALPLSKCCYYILKQDHSIRLAGEWLGEKEVFNKAKILTTDSRITFYAGKETDVFTQKVEYKEGKCDTVKLEQIARSKQVDLVLLRVSTKRTKMIPDLESYKMVKSFAGRRKVVIVYCLPKFERLINAESKA